MKINPRIVYGKYKNKKLNVPEGARPVTERVKISVFDILSDYINDSKVADIFAGSGSFGLEALSRGAREVVFVDKLASEELKKNLSIVDYDDRIKIKLIDNPYEKFVRKFKDAELFDLIFLDPPFAQAESTKYFKLMQILKPNGIIVLKYPANASEPPLPPTSFQIIREEIYGSTKIYFIKYMVR